MAHAAYARRAIPDDARITRWSAPDGWTLRCFAWPQPAGSTPRGSILFQGGRGDIIEKYLEAFGHWHSRGWTITAFDWRGQGGSGRLTRDPQCGHIDDFAQYIADFRAFHAEWQGAVPGPHIVIGHSMGGHLLLRAMLEGAAQPDAAILIAPMLGLKGPFGPWLGERIARAMCRIGSPERRAWKGNERPFTTDTRAELLTHDPDRYADELWWQAAQPELVTGPPSWHWVAEAFRSTNAMRHDPRVAGMAVPTLMLVADADALVDPRTAIAIGERMPDARIVRFGAEAAHELLRESDAVRNRALAEIDLFLEARAPA
ncbi:alpha/beta fold hydrolase [Sphingomonas sp. FW199]|uniref:alpha/beta fold hydrolase n=1 Tax=Sphingomonas sp. FW199 TaxID=3400217 RepID=UPI003CEFDA19